MIKETTENLYHFIVSQLPKKYGDYSTRTRFDDAGIPMYTCLIVHKGPRNHLTVAYDRYTEDFMICTRKPQGYSNEIIIHKYA